MKPSEMTDATKQIIIDNLDEYCGTYSRYRQYSIHLRRLVRGGYDTLRYLNEAYSGALNKIIPDPKFCGALLDDCNNAHHLDSRSYRTWVNIDDMLWLVVMMSRFVVGDKETIMDILRAHSVPTKFAKKSYFLKRIQMDRKEGNHIVRRNYNYRKPE